MRPATRYRPTREYRTEPSEDSDIVVALFRSAAIIAFAGRMVPDPRFSPRSSTWAMVVIAACYTLALMLGYLARRRWLTRRRRDALSAHWLWGALFGRRVVVQRVIALGIDLAMMTLIIRDVAQQSDRAPWLDIYYIIVAVGAIWFHRIGGVLTALGASLCVLWLTREFYPGTPFADWVVEAQIAARTAILIVVGVVTGWLARAREAERHQRERMGWEMGMARQVQSELLPDRLPDVPGYDVGLRFSSAGLVGGDYYDALIGPDGRLVIVLADVAGKSVAAVLHLSLLRSHLHQAVRDGLAPGEMASRLNGALVEALPPRSFIGLFCGALEMDSGRLSYVNCGHTPPVIVRGSGEPGSEVLYTGNIVLGVEPNPRYEEREVALGEGDVLVCATDGITEAMADDWTPLDTDGVIRQTVAVREASADAIAERILEAARAHAGRRPVDDATILVVKRRAAPSQLRGVPG
jgi:serine phosphatase RsbU (regulator of sigma subunit)